MGISINLEVSKSVTREEWKKVYEETLVLMKTFPLAERRDVTCRGIKTICLVPTAEREESYGWNNEKTMVGWNADGDYVTMHIAESYYLPRDLIDEDEVRPDAGDALMAAIPAYMNYDWENSRFNQCYGLWGDKTQGEPYHMYLLAIACLIEARLGEKAFVYGDITRGQCRRAVEMANQVLDTPIDIPDRCDMERFAKRVAKLPLEESVRTAVFTTFYLGTLDEDVGEYMRSVFSESACDEYWKDQFTGFNIGTIGFDRIIHDYLSLGFDLEKLCTLTNQVDKDGNPQYERFVKCIMDTKLHVMEKNCADALVIDQEESQPYSVYTLLVHSVFARVHNQKVNRYIPIEDIRTALNKGLADKCDVNVIIDEYLAKEAEQDDIRMTEACMSEDKMKAAYEQDAAEVFNQMMDLQREQLQKEFEKYDIHDHDCNDLLYYKKGNAVHPMIMRALGQACNFYKNILKEDEYARLMKGSAESRCRWLITQNRSILIRDKDWEKIFIDIEEHEESFSRYYPMMRVRADSAAIVNMITAMALNDELYAYCQELADIYGTNREEE